MRGLIFVTATVVLLGGSSTLAQVRSASTPNMPALGTASPIPTSPAMPLTPPVAVPGTIPTPGFSPLGAIQAGLGTSATLSAGATGAITTCATSGINAVSSGIIDASNAVATSGALATQPLPGATIPPNSYFAPSIMNGACNPAISAQNLTEFFNNTAVAPIPGLATIIAPSYSDATIPTAATEAGVTGLSPEITVPTPAVPSASPCAGNTTIAPTVITDPTTLMSSGIGMAVSSPPSLFGC